MTEHQGTRKPLDFDQIGPITNTVEDAAIILEVIAGEDDFDSTGSTKKVERYSQILDDKTPKRIAYFPECLESEGLEIDVKSAIENQIQQLKNNGHLVEAVSFSYLDYLLNCFHFSCVSLICFFCVVVFVYVFFLF